MGTKQKLKPDPSFTRSKSIYYRPIEADSIAEELRGLKPSNSTAAYAFKWDWLSENIMSKYLDNNVTGAEERRSKAIVKMLDSEAVCKQINEEGFGKTELSDVHLAYAQRYVAEVLGELDVSLFENAKFTSGATTSRTRKLGDAYYKYSETMPVDVTPGCYKYAVAIVKCTPLWNAMNASDGFNIVAGNRVTTVPKKSDIDRCIAKEPDMNAYLQHSVGRHIRKRLRRKGICLNDQRINQKLAKAGSISNDLCTIDLASASDLISDRIVWTLVGPDWYELMNALRSHYGTIPDGDTTRVIKWEKFSSMGNGFTFELESLIFASLVYAVSRVNGLKLRPCRNFHVYGDDIICPSSMYDSLANILHDVGFSVNDDKSFWDGPFRESCGKHYYEGDDVTPFYIRKPIDSPERVIWFLNRLREWSYDESFDVCDPTCYELWLRIRRKHIDPRFLGGDDTERTDVICSPERPNLKLTHKISKRMLNGSRAILRWFQFQPASIEADQVIWSAVGRHVDMRSDSISFLIPGIHSTAKAIGRATRESQSKWMWKSGKLFSNEIS